MDRHRRHLPRRRSHESLARVGAQHRCALSRSTSASASACKAALCRNAGILPPLSPSVRFDQIRTHATLELTLRVLCVLCVEIRLFVLRESNRPAPSGRSNRTCYTTQRNERKALQRGGRSPAAYHIHL